MTHKRLLSSLIFSALLAICAMSFPASAAGPEISVELYQVESADKYEAVVSIKNNPGISVYNLALAFDNSIIYPVSIKTGGVLPGGMVFASNLHQATTNEAKMRLEQVTAVWGAAEDAVGDGTLFTVIFEPVANFAGHPQVTLVVNKVISDEKNIAASFSIAGTAAPGSASDDADPHPDIGVGDGAGGGFVEDTSDDASGNTGGFDSGDEISGEAHVESQTQEPYGDGGFIGGPYTLDDADASTDQTPRVSKQGDVDGTQVPLSFGKVPQTGVADIALMTMAVCMFSAVSAASWISVIRAIRKRI